MDEAAELGNYLPLSFKSPQEQEYIAFLWDAFETNYTQGKYRLAVLAYHMRTMSCVYFNIWQIKQTEPGDFAKGLIGFTKDVERNLLEASSPFVFSIVNERAILRLLKLIACDNGKIGSYAKLVDDRNESAHPNGNIFYSTRPRWTPRSPRSCAWWMRFRSTPGRSLSTATGNSCSRTTTPRSGSIPKPQTRSARCSFTATTCPSATSTSAWSSTSRT